MDLESIPPSYEGWTALEVKPLPVRISEMLRDGILRRRWKPGDQIIESRVAKELGVGQNAVREALQELEFHGLVVKISNKGNFVTKLSKEDVDDVFRLRVELESLAVKWARRLHRPTDDDTARLNAILDRMEDGARQREFAKFSKADLEFHRAVWALSGNRPLQRALEVAAIPVFSYMLIQAVHETTMDLSAIVKEHRDWLDVIQNATPREAAAYTRDIVVSFWKQVAEDWRE